MIKIIKERTPITITECYIEFFYKNNSEAGFCFPATASGIPKFASMTPEAIANYTKLALQMNGSQRANLPRLCVLSQSLQQESVFVVGR